MVVTFQSSYVHTCLHARHCCGDSKSAIFKSHAPKYTCRRQLTANGKPPTKMSATVAGYELTLIRTLDPIVNPNRQPVCAAWRFQMPRWVKCVEGCQLCPNPSIRFNAQHTLVLLRRHYNCAKYVFARACQISSCVLPPGQIWSDACSPYQR